MRSALRIGSMKDIKPFLTIMRVLVVCGLGYAINRPAARR